MTGRHGRWHRPETQAAGGAAVPGSGPAGGTRPPRAWGTPSGDGLGTGGWVGWGGVGVSGPGTGRSGRVGGAGPRPLASSKVAPPLSPSHTPPPPARTRVWRAAGAALTAVAAQEAELLVLERAVERGQLSQLQLPAAVAGGRRREAGGGRRRRRRWLAGAGSRSCMGGAGWQTRAGGHPHTSHSCRPPPSHSSAWPQVRRKREGMQVARRRADQERKIDRKKVRNEDAQTKKEGAHLCSFISSSSGCISRSIMRDAASTCVG